MKQFMDAIVKPEAGPGLELRQVPVPVPKAGEVLIKIHKTAICGSDVHIYQWNDWAEPDHFRIVMLPQADELRAAMERMGSFLDGYRQK